ncbi:MAG TPA: exopolysaccharide biosynthesis polyprenyl glycosylphosphotransferase [Xanthobacteraceae bacterium]|nr:exopolysaccharide biosynthesis polyprenyl glycosylphosphotransferase [Xanthobacteraceae bacterium]
MGFIGGHESSGVGVRIPLSAMPRAHALDVSADDAVSLPALLVDGLVIFLLGALTGTGYQIFAFHSYGTPSIYAGTGLIVAIIFCGATRVMSSAHPVGASRDIGRARAALTAWIMTFLILVLVAFSLRIGTVFSRGAIFSFFLAGIPTVMATRVYVPRLLARTFYANAYRGTEAIIAASRGSVALSQICYELRSRGCAAVHTTEFDAECSSVEWPLERQRLLKRLIDTARVAGPGEIYLVSASIPHERVLSIQSGLRLVPRAVYIVPTEAVATLFGLPVRRVGRAIAVETQRVPMSVLARAIKRSIDIVVAASALLLLTPALLIIALVIKLDSPGPVFFRQRRNGYRGREFRINKFRTMSVLEDGEAVMQARRDDQRVTRVGRWLRKTSFDELPQLLNILRGEMSLVGPRPHAVAHDELYAKLIENYELRQHVKPGVTGWAQVNGLRGETPTVDLMFRRIEFDLWYAANSSVTLDLQILARTVFAVLRQDNAY